MNTFKTTVVAPSGEIFSAQNVQKISVRTQSGQITILAKHTPIVSVLKIGQVTITTDDNNNKKHFAVFGGFVEVRQDGEVIILADDAKRPPEIDLEEARRAREKSASMLEKAAVGTPEASKLQKDLERATTEIAVGGQV